MPLLRRTIRHGSAALLLAAPLLGTAAPATAAEPGPTTFVTPRYELRLATDRLALTTVRAGRTVLATAPGAFRFRIGADWHIVREVTGSTRDGDTVRVTAATDLPGVTVDLRITLRSDRYDMTWSLSGTRADALSTAYALSSAGHWYGHGENSDQTVQPWPLDSGQLVDTGFSPASYQVVSPLLVHLQRHRAVGEHRRPDGRADQLRRQRTRRVHRHRRPARRLHGVRREHARSGVPRPHRAGRKARTLRHPPADPRRLGAAYDSGDHLHPNDAGMKAFADSIGLTTLGLGRSCS
ncbi:hypothetical protein OOK58_56985 [Streptomyces sp. NBC_01728]|uniref:hypothetical protein n=1 Tax=unclassified Streptomyces TaxID=2593676 RepID=UPI00224DDECC|nr:MULTISPECIES: hypothetical protein [unclassified Streptomyces]MCX4460181.1 hypothetical protein [Streptomyces sp. NBC_01719]MCX4500488.1 hypothetical protein [Streptomyces sp. NBC_01728]